MAASVETTPMVRFGRPRMLFTGRYRGAGGGLGFDVAPDGQRFVMVQSDEASASRRLVLVQNWFEELRQRVPVP